jgi:transposase
MFGAAKPHCAYLLANRCTTRMKVLVHDGVGIRLADHASSFHPDKMPMH